ncbi:MAG: TonB-dependent receptor [Desulfobulbus sp.]|jgi:vitamin B12 transporter|uniref:TonB-dependent receptor plug domain-containing protein n=1 Tax=Desulfobulbus sp. TaxID=895 RepID=UPI00283EF5E1|nr:TonB-dependent receptor [Desulfobulbus sp.]MDR2549785.1 TonB-dependent receptor [Desulfobulbus sp.]
MAVKKRKKIDWRVYTLALAPLLAAPAVAGTLPDQETDAESQAVHRAEDIVVTASRTETLRQEATKSIDVVTSEDRDELQQYFLPELLANEPGVFFRANGGLGQWSNISIRGAGSQYTQYQYNGMPLRDAADTQTTLQYFIEDMFSGSNLERVEILKGTNSTLYGSQAMGGVINIIPRKWQAGPAAEWRNEFGPNGTWITNGRIAYGQEKYYIDFNPMYITTDGENYGGPNGYWYDNIGATFGAGIKPTDRTTVEFSGIFADTDLALGSSPSLDSSGNLVKNQAYADQHRKGQLYQVGLNWMQTISPLWDFALKGSQGATERHYFWSRIDGDRSDYDGKTTYVEMQHNLHPSEWLTLNLGVDYEQSDYEGREPRDKYAGDYTPANFDESWNNKDVFSQAQFALLDRSLFINLGGRYNDHEVFDGEAVWEASAAYLFKNSGTKLHAHVGTGYRTPGLYEVYGGYLANGRLVTIGNPDLQPEESIGYELGIDQSLADGKVQFGATYFATRFDDMIIFDNLTYRYENANEGKNSGIETYLRVSPWKMIRFDLAYTYIDSRYKADQYAGDWTRKEYLPRNKVDFIVTFYPVDKLTLAATVRWQDNKIVPLYDPSFNSVRWEESDTTTVNLAATYKALQNMDLFARVDNLFDKDYTESAYCMPGLSVYGGLKLHF